MILVVVMHAANMERVACILAVQKAAPVGIGGKGELEPAGHEPTPCA